MISDLAVIVPAADEEDHIANSLEAINEARLHLKASAAGRQVHVEVIVVLDDCHDATADIVARHLGVLAITSTAAKRRRSPTLGHRPRSRTRRQSPYDVACQHRRRLQASLLTG